MDIRDSSQPNINSKNPNNQAKFNAAATSAITDAAIYDVLTPEIRSVLIEQAVQTLVVPDPAVSIDRTPLQQAFDQAVKDATLRVVKERIDSDPMIEATILRLLGPLVSSSADNTLGEAIGVALGTWLMQKAEEQNL